MTENLSFKHIINQERKHVKEVHLQQIIHNTYYLLIAISFQIIVLGLEQQI